MDAISGTDDPFELFADWFAAAWANEPDVAHAAALATVGVDGRPSCRIVLVQYASGVGFEFHTNYESQKGRELAAHPDGALTFHWKSLGRQVRIEGPVERLTEEASDAYWDSRPRASQISAMTSRQSTPIDSRAELEERRTELSGGSSDSHLARPTRWGGFRLAPLRMEFWEHRDDRLHYRLDYTRGTEDAAWFSQILQP